MYTSFVLILRRSWFWREFRGTFGVDADELAPAALVFEFDEALDKSKERIVLAAADVVAGLPLSSALAGKDVAAEDMLTAKFLEPKPLCIRIAAVSG